jgi:hypothetical protein
MQYKQEKTRQFNAEGVPWSLSDDVSVVETTEQELLHDCSVISSVGKTKVRLVK